MSDDLRAVLGREIYEATEPRPRFRLRCWLLGHFPTITLDHGWTMCAHCQRKIGG